MNKVRAKFRCDQNEKDEHAEHHNLVFTAVTSGSKENESFWKYTPSGRLEMQIDNPYVVAEFEVGKEYYLGFSSAD